PPLTTLPPKAKASPPSPPGLVFESIDVGRTSTPRPATLTNTGGRDLKVKAVALTGKDAAQFMLEPSTCTTIAPGESCTIIVRYAPKVADSHSAALTFTNNSDDKADSTQDVTLSGSATLPAPPASPPPSPPPPPPPPPTPLAPPFATDQDADADAIVGTQDLCPTQAGTLDDGCPDRDDDGTSDRVDKCPTASGDLANGCQRPLDADIRGVWRVNERLTRLVTLFVRTTVGSRIHVRCGAKRKVCPFSTRVIKKTTKRTTSLTKYFNKARVLPAGVSITVRVTRADRLGSYERLLTRTGRKLPRVTHRCIDHRSKAILCQ
ncbi:MAG: choice-of-anchor D domain-containing protein, partial [Solirubrobacteraceae bacterium]